MSIHEEDYAAAADDIHEYYGGECIYSDPKVQPRTLRATIHPERTSRRKNANGGWDWVRVRLIYIYDHDREDDIENFRDDATVDIDGTRYRVESVENRAGGRIKLNLIRAARAEISRQRRGGM